MLDYERLKSHYNKFMNRTLKRIIFIFILFLYFFSVNNILENSGDNASYMIFAKSIISEGKLLFLNQPDKQESGYNIFIYPVILSPIIYFFDSNIYFLKFVSVIFSLLNLFLFYKIFFHILDKKIFIFSILIFALNPVQFDYSHQIMSESVYLFFVLLFFYFLQKNYNLIFISLILAIIFFTRNIGIVCYITLLFYLIYKKEFKKIIIVSILLFCLLIPVSYYFKVDNFKSGNIYYSIIKMKSQYNPDEGTRKLLDIITTCIKNFGIYVFKIMPDTFFYPIFFEVKKYSFIFFFKVAVGLILTAAFVIGMVKLNNKNLIIFKIYLILNFIILFIWQISSNRYLHPLVPFIGIFIVYFFYTIRFPFKHTVSYFYNKNFFVYILSSILILNAVSDIYLSYLERTGYKKKEWQNYFLLLDYAKKNKITQNTIMTRKPTLAYIITRMKSIGYPLTDDIELYNDTINKNNVEIIIRDNLNISGINTAQRYLENYIKKFSDNLEVIYKIDNYNIIFKIKKPLHP